MTPSIGRVPPFTVASDSRIPADTALDGHTERYGNLDDLPPSEGMGIE